MPFCESILLEPTTIYRLSSLHLIDHQCILKTSFSVSLAGLAHTIARRARSIAGFARVRGSLPLGLGHTRYRSALDTLATARFRAMPK